jgi:WhiB family redox-sensing transcriptional regulator
MEMTIINYRQELDMQRRRPIQFPEATLVRCGQLDEDWRTESVCRQGYDPEIWFPTNAIDSRLGVAICKTCPVMQECLSYATAHQERHGTWGGLSEWQRQQGRLSPVVRR